MSPAATAAQTCCTLLLVPHHHGTLVSRPTRHAFDGCCTCAPEQRRSCSDPLTGLSHHARSQPSTLLFIGAIPYPCWLTHFRPLEPRQRSRRWLTSGGVRAQATTTVACFRWRSSPQVRTHHRAPDGLRSATILEYHWDSARHQPKDKVLLLPREEARPFELES